ncbi:ankyrin repeat domain-containing protein [Streptomyces sp. NPDC058084]|uniref:ankyrin repeat domain-containing protein n=1 Tax=Streptomyces sp. NPDC058084 TaxID=3346333 RepID=UPI0036DFBB26
MVNVEILSPWTPAHQAVESGDMLELVRLLEDGADPEEVCCGMTLLMHAIDIEGDSAVQSGKEMEAKATAIVLAYGADPLRLSPSGESPVEAARSYGHGRALLLLEAYRSLV